MKPKKKPITLTKRVDNLCNAVAVQESAFGIHAGNIASLKRSMEELTEQQVGSPLLMQLLDRLNRLENGSKLEKELLDRVQKLERKFGTLDDRIRTIDADLLTNHNTRLGVLEKHSHEPFDFTNLINRLQRVERELSSLDTPGLKKAVVTLEKRTSDALSLIGELKASAKKPPCQFCAANKTSACTACSSGRTDTERMDFLSDMYNSDGEILFLSRRAGEANFRTRIDNWMKERLGK